MSSRLKSRNEGRVVFFLTFVFLIGVSLFWAIKGDLFCTYDAMALDYFYRFAVKRGCGPKRSFLPGITYLTINDDTYQYFKKNILDRKDLARINQALSKLNPEAVAYDMIFAMPGPEESDRLFAQSLLTLGSVYLPVGCALSEIPASSNWEGRNEGDKFYASHLIHPIETGDALPFHAVRVLMQHENFMGATKGSGDISIRADPDGLYRHAPMVVRVGEGYLPTLSLAMFLNQSGIHLKDMVIQWGKNITLQSSSNGHADSKITIPIDKRGLAFVPFVAPMGKDFPEIAVHTFLQAFEDEDLRGNLTELFEGNYVFVADVATGASDLGATPLEKAAPLVTIHASLLNAMVTGTFYSQWDPAKVMFFFLLTTTLLGFSALFRFSGILYGSGFFLFMGLPMVTWNEFTHFKLFPITTVAIGLMLFFFTLVAILEYTATRDRAFIRKIFSRYVPESVINELMANPNSLQLGGEERIATVLFSDIADFTTISERLTPKDLVSLLNHYLTEMTTIILENGGIIDKFQGDAIMAEFGVPLFCEDHADRAVAAGLTMQHRLAELRLEWRQKGLPELYCRVGINTGKMVVGNMGSQRVLDYTVIGDAVNLASRLEGANKYYGTSLMISEFTLKALTSNRYRLRLLDLIRVKGKSEAVRVHEVYGHQEEELTPQMNSYYLLYDKAYTAYLARDFTLAVQYFQEALALLPNDRSAGQMLHRIKGLSPGTLSPDWDGSVGLTSK